LDQQSWLRRPTDLFFRDSPSLAERFGMEIQGRLIDRPEGLWQALAAAGVRNLSDAVETDVLEERHLEPGGIVADRLRKRRRLLLRVLSTEDHDAAQKLDMFGRDVVLSRLSQLVIQQSLDVGDSVHRSEPYPGGAVFLVSASTLLYVDGDTGPFWVELARELARALSVSGFHAASIAATFKTVLSEESEEAVQRELDVFGFPALDEVITAHAEPTIASGLGGAALSEEESGVELDSAESSRAGQGGAPVGAAVSGERAESADGAGGGSGPDPALGDPAHQLAPNGSGSTGGARTSADKGTAGVGGTSAEVGTAGVAGTSAVSGGVTQTRLRSYVLPARTDGDGISVPPADGDDEVERAGVEAVLEFERAHDREPEEMPPQNPGFDIRSVDADGHVRIIEVKATALPWGLQGVALSSTQFATAEQRREEFWLYVVDNALTEPRVHPINDPASKVDQYLFDGGWLIVSEPEADPVRPLPILRLPTEPAGLQTPVPFLDAESAAQSSPAHWVPCKDRHCRDDWFAVRIEGDALGLAYRGGVAFIEPLDRPAEDDELILAVLHDQIDPDTGRRTTIRLWRPERDLAGNQLRLRLWSNGSVEPLTVREADGIEVRGIVRATLRFSDLDDLGYG
jgi:hypothetical protein